ncbi:class I SAM-dependent methyltransferase [Arcobacter cloacae]|uniref:Uncharacterized protein n=1 Tax=Arcobacter cloacae TaxID=1054034 RepID=A0A6M8NQV5_9BACT|nr:class I SAM-dependent methyltransferase [Arcobacter cloacae]QKF90947.1 SAM-dependent methyltransferase [Arcobacter cloacae]RXI43054.1 hypothetical protein CP963_00340 [Arcobacter cloacae]
MKQNKESWNKIYDKGYSYMMYPDETLVILYHRIKNILPNHITCLDYGFGSGNNSEFIIDKVNEFYGIEISEIAKEITSKRLFSYENFDKNNLFINSNNYVEEFEEKFDLILAWHVISYNTDESVKEVISHFHKYLKKGGILITTLATREDISYYYSKEISKNTFQVDERIPSQKDCIVVIPENKEDFENYFEKFSILDIGFKQRTSFLKPEETSSHYFGVLRKDY